MVPANVNDYFVIRFCVCSQNSSSEDIGNFVNLMKERNIINSFVLNKCVFFALSNFIKSFGTNFLIQQF